MVSPTCGPSNLVSRNEEILVNARKSFYEEARVKKRHEKQLKLGHYIGKDCYQAQSQSIQMDFQFIRLK